MPYAIIAQTEVAEILRRKHRWNMNRENVRCAEERALAKLRDGLAKDPYIRDWLRERGLTEHIRKESE